MKIKIERNGKAAVLYHEGDELKPNSFYEDDSQGIYWTDGEGGIEGGVWEDGFVDADSVDYPLRDSNVTSITISK